LVLEALELAVTLTIPVPMPVVGDGAAQLAALVAVHAQFGLFAKTRTDPLPPPAARGLSRPFGPRIWKTVTLHAVASCETRND
jgi:hypothetical protein